MARLRFDAVAIGDAILDIVTPPIAPGGGDRQSRVHGFSHLPGGNATNFALAFSALGGRTAFVGAVGRDSAGDLLRGAYRSSMVRARLRVSRTRPTGMTVAVTHDDGTRHLITAVGANAEVRQSDVPPQWLLSTRHVHRAGYWWATGLMGKPTQKVLAQARKAGATTSLDTASDPEGWPQSHRDAVMSALPHVDIFFGNEEEVCRLAGRYPLEEAVDALLTHGSREIVVHEGSRGSSAFTSTSVETARAFPAAPMNPTGCGDVFNAAYVTASLVGACIPTRLRFANAAAAWHLETLARPYPTRHDLRVRYAVSLRPS